MKILHAVNILIIVLRSCESKSLLRQFIPINALSKIIRIKALNGFSNSAIRSLIANSLTRPNNLLLFYL